MLKRVITWFVQLFAGNTRQSPAATPATDVGTHHVQYVSRTYGDVPNALATGVLHLIEDGTGNYWLAILRCPCGCGATIQLPMTPQAHPCWQFRGTFRQPTLLPSVHRITGCKSHFVLRSGIVQWCRDP